MMAAELILHFLDGMPNAPEIGEIILCSWFRAEIGRREGRRFLTKFLRRSDLSATNSNGHFYPAGSFLFIGRGAGEVFPEMYMLLPRAM
jgi:hypothetical protein